MKPNPGGQIAPDEILGRDELIAEIWEILAGRNIYMNDLRRIGKTMILNKMDADTPEGWLVSKRDLGGLRTAAEFSTQVYRDSLKLLGKKKRSLRTMGDLLGKLAGAEIAGVLKLPDGAQAPWKEVLTRTFADLHEVYESGDDRIVFLWDEVPFLLDNIRTDEGSNRAMEVLDTLRSLSQDYPGVRLVLTGSVGIHHVLTQLRKDGYNNSPLNTFEHKAPGPLAHRDAVELASRLIGGANLDVDDLASVADTVASLAGDVPFYIHRLISRMRSETPVTAGDFRDLLARELTDSDNDWDLAHYGNRISKYYPDEDDAKIVRVLLDSLASTKVPRLLPQLLQEVRALIDGADDDRTRSLLKLLLADHYLKRDESGAYEFRLEIVRRWWVLDRGLGA